MKQYSPYYDDIQQLLGNMQEILDEIYKNVRKHEETVKKIEEQAPIEFAFSTLKDLTERGKIKIVDSELVKVLLDM